MKSIKKKISTSSFLRTTNYELRTNSGFVLLEAVLAVALFVLLGGTVVGATLFGQDESRISTTRSRAVFLADEGLEATRNIRDESFANLSNGLHGLVISSSRWIFSGTSDTEDGYTRQVNIATVDANRKKVSVSVSWQERPGRQGQAVAATYLTKWREKK